MQLVINIDDDLYKSIIGHRYKITYQQKCDYEDLKNAIEDGVPLPKGHGRLVDADEIDNNIYDLTRSMDLNYGQISEVVDTAPTIIEADEVESEESTL